MGSSGCWMERPAAPWGSEEGVADSAAVAAAVGGDGLVGRVAGEVVDIEVFGRALSKLDPH